MTSRSAASSAAKDPVSDRDDASPAAPEQVSAARRVGDRMRSARRELMAAEFESVAMRLFAERGYDNVSVDDIAAAAGVSARTFYRYFVAKEDVLWLFPQRQGDMVQELLDQDAGPSFFDAYAGALQRYAETVDLEELSRWWRIVTSSRSLFGAAMTTQYQLRRRVEPVHAQRFTEAAAHPLYFELVTSSCLDAMATASRYWFEHGGDFAATVREALGQLAEGLRKPLS